MTFDRGATTPSGASRLWRDVLLPKEHGSWSLALEPIALGLLAAPSVAGSWLSLAAFAGFLARRPLKLAVREWGEPRGSAALQALAACAAVALAALVAAIMSGHAGWIAWLVPSAIGGALFVRFDLRNSGREEFAEIAGAAAFAGVTGAIAAAAGSAPTTALMLSFVMLARAVPTVMFVRARVRGAKTGAPRPAAALLVAGLAAAGALLLSARGVLPAVAAIAIALLGIRAAILLLRPWPRLRARTLGIQELITGAAYVAVLGLTWSLSN